MALRFGVVKTILLIAFLIVIVQLLTVYHFTLKYTSQIKEKSRRKVDELDEYITYNGENVRFPVVNEQRLLSVTERKVQVSKLI